MDHLFILLPFLVVLVGGLLGTKYLASFEKRSTKKVNTPAHSS